MPKTTRYEWSIGNRTLDVDAMNDAAAVLLGTHDFTAFSASRGTDAKENPVKLETAPRPVAPAQAPEILTKLLSDALRRDSLPPRRE